METSCSCSDDLIECHHYLLWKLHYFVTVSLPGDDPEEILVFPCLVVTSVDNDTYW